MAGEADTTQAGETRSPEEIRRDIEATREELGDTVEALAAKADVKAQARERVDSVKEQARGKVEDLKGKAQSATPEDAQAQAQVVAEKARQNPLPFAVGGALVVGFLLGRITAS
jgi:ElaB/YqjD/DUF883 family membrane-anchored ribosome-binding protein